MAVNITATQTVTLLVDNDLDGVVDPALCIKRTKIPVAFSFIRPQTTGYVGPAH